jgi:AraC-like DNA-binding protein
MDALSETLRVVQLVGAIFINARFTAPWCAPHIVSAALNALHKRPAHDWTLEELARESGTSRSVLAERFQQLVGSSPIQYLTQWRMLLASNLLSRCNQPLASIAEAVGYQTDTAFSRAFRREFGTPPAAWRRANVRPIR